MLGTEGKVFPEIKYQRCTVHFYRNVFSFVPRFKVKLIAKVVKAIRAQESKESALMLDYAQLCHVTGTQ